MTSMNIEALVKQDASQALEKLKESDLNEIVNNAVRKLNQGEGDPVAVMAASAKFAYIFTELQKRIRDKVTDEITKYRNEMKPDIELQGAKFSFSTNPRRYNYSVSGDWLKAKQEEEQAAKIRKGIETALRAAKYVDQETGEVLELEPISGGDETVRVSIK